MSHLNGLDNFNFSSFTEAENETEKSKKYEETSTKRKTDSSENMNEELSQINHFDGDFEEKENDSFHENLNNNLNDNKRMDSLSNFYTDRYASKENSVEDIGLYNYNNDSSISNNNDNNNNNSNDVVMNDRLYNKDDMHLRRDSKVSFENSGEQFFDKDSDLGESDKDDVWEIERLKRIEERKEYETRMKKEIKEKAAEDLRKWYEEMDVKIKERKEIFKQQKLEEEKKKKEDLKNKTWVKVSQYLDFEKGEYFKEDSRIKQILLKLIKQENS